MRGAADLAVIGDPIWGSLSPAMHSAALSSLGIEGTYVAVRVPLARLRAVFPKLRQEYVGVNVTRPLKEAVLNLCDQLSSEARCAGSVNTITFQDGRAYGASTDVSGFLPALRMVTKQEFSTAVILGTGGAARAAAFALKTNGTRVHVAGRNRDAGAALASELGVYFGAIPSAETQAALRSADLLVNATPLGGIGEPDISPLPSDAPLPVRGVVFDLVYRPRTTPLLQRARAEGCEIVEGLCLLVEQAALSFEIWTGQTAPRGVMLTAAMDRLEARQKVSRSMILQSERA